MPIERRSITRVPMWAAYAALGLVMLVAHQVLFTAGDIAQSWFYDVVGGSAVLVSLVAIHRLRPDRRLPWWLMVLGQASFVAGDVAWNSYASVGEEPFPSVADGLYLTGYPFIALGLFLLIRRRLGDGDRGGILDAAILTTAAAILSWTFFMQPLVSGSELDSLGLSITLAYPIADLLVIGVALGLLTTPGARTWSFRILLLSFVALLVADQVYAAQNLYEAYDAGTWLDSVYLLAYIGFGVAVAHPSMRRLTDPHPVTVTWLGPVRLICLGVAMITGPLLVTLGPDAEHGLAVVAAGTALLSILVLARLAGLVGILARDVAKRRVLEAQLSYQAFHDPLTGLANRRRFIEQAQGALGERARHGSLAALFLDLDDFKTVNDTLGHAAGDELLITVAARIRAELRDIDLAARLGGDEFGILLLGIPEVGYAETVARRLLEAIRQPLMVAETRIEVGASIGIALDTDAMGLVDELLGDADVAMYQAKALGKGRYRVFTGNQDGNTVRDRTWAGHSPLVRRPSVGPARLETGAG